MISKQVETDLGYVKDLVRRSDREPTPASIYLLWAAIVLVGFALVDLASGRAVGFFWMIAGPLGGIVSGLLGRRAGLRSGQIQREVGIRHALHWGGMLVLTALAVLLAVTEHIPRDETGRVILLIVAFGWWSALFFERYVWTALGLLIAVALVIVALHRGRRHATQES
jgi:uncharacterized membrane protein